MLSSSKVTADYLAQWDDPADRERHLARFADFDGPSRTPERGGSILSKEAASNAKSTTGHLRKVNVVTKLPTLKNEAGQKTQQEQIEEQQMLAFGPDFFTMH